MLILGSALVGIFYSLILLLGIWVARREGTVGVDASKAKLISANSRLELWVAVLTMVATEVGGAFITGTAEETFKNGFLWAIAPLGYSLSMTLNGVFFVHKLREKKYVTLIDALQDAYGDSVGAALYLPSCIGDVCWTAAILSALGSTLEIILGIERSWTIPISAAVVTTYTMMGGLFAVAYTDTIQVFFLFSGLFFVLPFVLSSTNVSLEKTDVQDWTGSVGQTGHGWCGYIDTWLLVILGGIPWQPYYQRALATKTNDQALILSISASVLSICCMVPPVIMGVAAKTVNWDATPFGDIVNRTTDVLPALIKSETPSTVAFIALAAISAAVMSSMDSSLLSGASYLTHNFYGQIVQPRFDAFEAVTMLRLTVIMLGTFSTVLSLATTSVYDLWVLAGDLGYVIVFPHFLAAVHFPHLVNGTGAAAAASVGSVLRLLMGEPLFGLPPILPSSAFLPVKTMLMLTTLLTLLVASKIAACACAPRRTHSPVPHGNDQN